MMARDFFRPATKLGSLREKIMGGLGRGSALVQGVNPNGDTGREQGHDSLLRWCSAAAAKVGVVGVGGGGGVIEPDDVV